MEPAHHFSSKPATKLLFFFLIFVQLVPQFRSSQIDEVSKFGDSTIILHRICQIPMNCQCKLLLVFVTVRETFVNSSPSPEKFLFGTEKTESREWQDLAPRQRIGDCSEIHLPHSGFCDLPLSSPQTFLLVEKMLRQCLFCNGSLFFLSSSIHRNFGLLGSEYKYCASLVNFPPLS